MQMQTFIAVAPLIANSAVLLKDDRVNTPILECRGQAKAIVAAADHQALRLRRRSFGDLETRRPCGSISAKGKELRPQVQNVVLPLAPRIYRKVLLHPITNPTISSKIDDSTLIFHLLDRNPLSATTFL